MFHGREGKYIEGYLKSCLQLSCMSTGRWISMFDCKITVGEMVEVPIFQGHEGEDVQAYLKPRLVGLRCCGHGKELTWYICCLMPLSMIGMLWQFS